MPKQKNTQQGINLPNVMGINGGVEHFAIPEHLSDSESSLSAYVSERLWGNPLVDTQQADPVHRRKLTTSLLDRMRNELTGHLQKDAESHNPFCRGGLTLPTAGDVTSGEKKDRPHPTSCQKGCCRRHLVEMIGAGSERPKLPTIEEVLQYTSMVIANVPPPPEVENPEKADYMPVSVIGKLKPSRRKGARSGAVLELDIRPKDTGDDNSGNQSTSGTSPTVVTTEHAALSHVLFLGMRLKHAQEVVRQIFHEGRYDAFVARKFNRDQGIVKQCQKTMGAERQKGLNDVSESYQGLREFYRAAIPSVFQQLKGKYPDASDDQLLEAAVEILDSYEKLASPLYVLGHYTDGLMQELFGLYEQLPWLVFTVEQQFNLMLTGNIQGSKRSLRKGLKSHNFKVGCVFLARAGADGPATIPGGKGPIGFHLILVPEDEVNHIMLMMVLYLHELRHDIFNDIEGLPEQSAMAVLQAIKQFVASGKCKLSQEKIDIAGNTVALVNLIATIFVCWLGEIDADLPGGVESTGYAFGLGMDYTFGAFNSKGSACAATKSESLRHSSVYQITKDGKFFVEPHPIDFFRLFLVAAALDECGLPAEAEDLRQVAVMHAGVPTPEFLIWEDIDGMMDPIQIALADLVQFAPVVARALMKTPLPALGGLSNHDIVDWSPKREAKVQVLKGLLLAGRSDLPDTGDFSANYAAAACSQAFVESMRPDRDPNAEAVKINALGLQMLATIKARLASASPTDEDSQSGHGGIEDSDEAATDDAPSTSPDSDSENPSGTPGAPGSTPGAPSQSDTHKDKPESTPKNKTKKPRKRRK